MVGCLVGVSEEMIPINLEASAEPKPCEKSISGLTVFVWRNQTIPEKKYPHRIHVWSYICHMFHIYLHFI